MTHETSLSDLYHHHHHRVQRALIHWGLTPADAEDLSHEVFVVAARRLPSFEGRSSVATWLLGIARKLASDYRRGARHRKEVCVARLPERACAETPADVLARSQEIAAVQRAVSGLKKAPRAVVSAYVLHEVPMAEVARAQRIPLQTAYARLYSAKASLRTALAEAA